MLNSTKTWQEELRDIKDPSGQYFISYLGQNEIKALEQFISDLIAQTREKTISEVEEMIKKEFLHQNLYCEAQDLRWEILEEINKLKK